MPPQGTQAQTWDGNGFGTTMSRVKHWNLGSQAWRIVYFHAAWEARLRARRITWASWSFRHDRTYKLHAREAMGGRGVGTVPWQAGCRSGASACSGASSGATSAGD